MSKRKSEAPLSLMGLLHRAHPWHGVEIGDEAPTSLNCYIEIVPTDTVKYELDKASGILKLDRPQKYSNCCPSLYGLIPQTYCNHRVGKYCSQKTKRKGILGDGDPLDICVLAERPIVRGDFLVKAIPVGGFRLIDGDEADDKIIAVQARDLVFGDIRDISECPVNLIERLKHYFLTYKDIPSDGQKSKKIMEFISAYGREEAHHVIELARQDYQDHFGDIQKALSSSLEGRYNPRE